jgi:hypothetical protein
MDKSRKQKKEAFRVDWKCAKLKREDWDFSKCFDEEVQDCFDYEFARESKEAISYIERGRAPARKKTFENLFRLIREDRPEYVGEKTPPTLPAGLFSFCPEWPDEPYLFTLFSMKIAASRTVNLGGTVATVGFPDIGLQGFAPKLAKGEIASLSGAGDDPRYFQISAPVQPGNSGGALVDERGNVIGIVSAKLDASTALAMSGSLPENVNYAVKSSLLLSFLESVPDVDAKLKAPNTVDEKFEEVVKSAQDAAVLVLVY